MGILVALAWTWIKSNWQLVAIGLAIAAVIGYITVLRLEVDHYKTKAGELELEISTAKANQVQEEERQNLAFDAQTKKYADSLRAKGDAIMKGYADVAAKIKAHEASKHIVLTPDVVELFNSTVGPEPRASEAPRAKQEDDGKASALAKTLNDLLEVSNENNANHQVCIEQVLEWQAFWKDYVNARTLRHSD
jgi:uncharacterized membrane-anchored protein YhcB (DUF1043 family)